MKALMVCLGLEPGAVGWKAQTNPLSYSGGKKQNFVIFIGADFKSHSNVWNSIKGILDSCCFKPF